MENNEKIKFCIDKILENKSWSSDITIKEEKIHYIDHYLCILNCKFTKSLSYYENEYKKYLTPIVYLLNETKLFYANPTVREMFKALLMINNNILGKNATYSNEELSTQNCLKLFGLDPITYSNNELTKLSMVNIYGNNMWNLLTYMSIILYIKFGNTKILNNQILRNFCAIIEQLNLFLLCSFCRENYEKKKVHENFIIPQIKENGNILSLIFLIHNFVNVVLEKNIFNIEDFREKYFSIEENINLLKINQTIIINRTY